MVGKTASAKGKPKINLIEMRERKGWTKSEVAEKLGFSRSYYSMVEDGKINISVKMMYAIMAVFGVRYEEFYLKSPKTDFSGADPSANDPVISDALTNILNKPFFMEFTVAVIERSLRRGGENFCIVFSPDHFKKINETYGLSCGDKVLKDIADRVKKIIRNHDLFGRYGDDKFIMLISELDKANAMNIVERIRLDIFETPFGFEGTPITVSASFGAAAIAKASDMDIAIRFADEALGRAKEEGRNKVVFFER